MRCTRGLPGPGTVTLTAAVCPAASVPDIGATTTLFSRPAGSETDQFTVPPDAVSVIDPPPGGVTASVAGLTLSVPAPGALLVLVPALGLGLTPALLAPAGAGAADTSAAGPSAPELPRAVGSTLGRAVAPALGVPGWPSWPRAGPARPVAPGVAAPAGGTAWCGGTAIKVTPAATAAAVPAMTPAWAGQRVQPGGTGLMKGPGKAMMAERVRGLRHRSPMSHGGGGVPGGEPQYLITETGRQGPRQQRQRRDRRDPEEHGRRDLPAPPPGADAAPLHVPVDALAHQYGQVAVPVPEHRVKLRAVLPPGPGHDERPERDLQLVAGPGQQRVRVVAGDSEHAGHLAAAQALPQLQFEDFPLGRPDPAERVAYQRAQVRPFYVGGDVGRFVGHVRRLLDGRVLAAGPKPPVALVPRHRVQPGPESLRVAQPGHPGAAITNVSCTASAASAGSRSIVRQKLYSGVAYLSYASASPAGSPATMAATTSRSRMAIP